MVRPLPSAGSAAPDASRALFADFLGTMSLSDFPPPYIAVVLSRFTARTLRPSPPGQRWDLPVPAHEACMRARGLRPRGVSAPLATARCAVLPSARCKVVGTPELTFSRLHRPARIPPVNASPETSRPPAHDSRLRWFATPSSWGTSTPYLVPVLTGAFVAVGTPVAGRPPHRSVREGLPHTAPTSGQTPKRCAGKGCWIRGTGSQRSAKRFMRAQVVRSFSLRRRNARRQARTM